MADENEGVVRTIGVPMDLGTDRRGVDMGPAAIRYGGLADRIEATGNRLFDAGDLSVPHVEERTSEKGNAKYLDAVSRVCDRLAGEITDARAAGEFPIVLGGDHSVAIGTLGGMAKAGQDAGGGDGQGNDGTDERDGDLGVLWFDAHADFNIPETTPSGNVHGMGLAAALGIGPFGDHPDLVAPDLDPGNVALIGLRSVDDGEREELIGSDVSTFPMGEIDERGVVSVVEEALSVVSERTDRLHVSLDLDWLDPRRAPGVGTPVRGGVTYREAHSAMETVAEWDAGEFRSLELVEVNPILDEGNETAELATELAASALGERVL